MTPNPIIKLGQRVRDVTSGVEGIAESYAVTLHGNVRVAVQPPYHDDKLPDFVWVDDVGLDIVDDVAFVARAIPCKVIGTDRLGQRVVDRVSAFKGTIVDAIFSMNGCVRHGVMGTYDKPGVDPLLCYFDEGRLDPVQDAKPVSVMQTGTGASRTRGRP